MRHGAMKILQFNCMRFMSSKGTIVILIILLSISIAVQLEL